MSNVLALPCTMLALAALAACGPEAKNTICAGPKMDIELCRRVEQRLSIGMTFKQAEEALAPAKPLHVDMPVLYYFDGSDSSDARVTYGLFFFDFGPRDHRKDNQLRVVALYRKGSDPVYIHPAAKRGQIAHELVQPK